MLLGALIGGEPMSHGGSRPTGIVIALAVAAAILLVTAGVTYGLSRGATAEEWAAPPA